MSYEAILKELQEIKAELVNLKPLAYGQDEVEWILENQNRLKEATNHLDPIVKEYNDKFLRNRTLYVLKIKLGQITPF